MGNSFACFTSQKAMIRSKHHSAKVCDELQYSDSEQPSLNSLNNLKKKKKKAKLKRNDHKANSRRLSSTGDNDDGAVRIKMVLTKKEADLLLSMLRENESIGGVSFDFCGAVRSHEWKPSLQRIEEEDEFC
ncbi:hypothetical protein MA16_Dca003072 [Dendrobium catenatum]|uniref:Uncharacterized protein n=1 Tax=Dendrobium catenatum TaxID=906689 RepID=A0A2I0XBR1_9ASPA|nr:hypothetical protein MA16_Dca003072 [Dendrobium catenatum]